MTSKSQEGNRQITEDNHYVPQLYLKRWANEGRVWTYRILVPHAKCPIWRAYSLAAIAKRAHLYTKATLSGESDEFERWLCNDFETPAEPVIDRVIAGGRLHADDWQKLIRFAASQDVRTPARLVEMLHRANKEGEHFQQDVTETVQEAEAIVRQGGRLPATAAVATRFPFPIRVTTYPAAGPEKGGLLKAEVVLGRALWLFQLEQLLTHTVAVLTNHDWTILRAPRGCQWPTSDDPVLRINFDESGSGRYGFGGGWSSPNSVILLPLGPEHALYTEIGKRKPWTKGTRLPPEVFAQMQRMIIEHAHRYVFALEKHSDVGSICPRKEDANIYRAENEMWTRWPVEQSVAERELLTKPAAPISMPPNSALDETDVKAKAGK